VNFDVSITLTNSVLQVGPTGSYKTNTNQGNITLTGVTRSYSAGETVHNGIGVTAVVSSWTVGTGVLVPTTFTQKFIVGDIITGNTSGATGTVSVANQHLCTLTNGGGNYDYDTGMLIPTPIP
jgi:hypothetical protein